MRNSIQNLAKAAVTGLVKPDDLVVDAGHKAIDHLFSWLPGREKSRLERLIEQVEAELQELADTEFAGNSDLELAVSNAILLFDQFGLTATEMVDLGLRPDRATDELLSRANEVLQAAGEAVAGLCRDRIIPRVYELLLADPETIAELSPAVTRTLLSQREAIKEVPDEVGAALRRMLGRRLMVDPTRIWRPENRDIYLLRAEYEVVPFHEQRQQDVDRLLDWCATVERIAVRIITGVGGTGKTRLMIELCRQARTQGWRAGFLHRETPTTPSWELDGLVDGEEPVLLVVDYAETRCDVLVPVLRRLGLEHGTKTRVILVARGLADWWPSLRRADPELQELLDDARVPKEKLSPIALPVEQRPQILEAAAVAFSKKLFGTDLRDRRLTPAVMVLDAPHFANALFLHIAALAAVVGDPVKEEDALLRFVLEREERHWQAGLVGANLARDLDVASVGQTEALITLAGGAEHKVDARALLGSVPHLSGLSQPKRDRLIDLLHRLYPGERYLEPLQPDLLGEELVDRALSDDPDLLEAAFIEGVSRERIKNALTVLTRLARRCPEAERWLEQALRSDLERLAEPSIQVAIETGHPVGNILGQALERQPLKDPARLEPMIPDKTTELLDVGVVVMSQQWERLLAIPKPWTEEVNVQAARIANDLSVRLSENGRHDEALATADEAVDLYRALAKKAPDAYRPDLAGTLNTVAICRSKIGRLQEAIAPAQEAVAIRRKLAEKAPDASRPYLAHALTTLASILGSAGQYEKALGPAQEGTVLYRKLARETPDAYRPALALALGNLALCSSRTGRDQTTLASTKESVDLYRALAEKAPDAYLPDLARALHNLAGLFSEAGPHWQMFPAIKEAIAIRRELAKHAPHAYEPALARSLSLLADWLEKNSDLVGALQHLQESIELYRPYFLNQPSAFVHGMRPLVKLYIRCCAKLGRTPDRDLLAPILEVMQQMTENSGDIGSRTSRPDA